MFAWLKKSNKTNIVTVAWVFNNNKSSMIWADPKPISREVCPHKAAKSVSYCPAVLDYEARLFEIVSPIDLNLACELSEHGARLINLDKDKSSIRVNKINELIAIVAKNEWRDPNKPIIQLISPYVFISDSEVYLSQLPAFQDYPKDRLPGLTIGGRMPIRTWPRALMWAFEWHDLSLPLIVKRGQPLFYVKFETENLNKKVRLCEGEYTPELDKYCQSILGVSAYVKQTFSLFSLAAKRRPKVLVKPLER